MKISIRMQLILIFAGAITLFGGLYSSAVLAQSPDSSIAVKSSYLVVEGRVYSEETGQPLSHVTVQIVGGGSATKSNEEGRYRLRMKPGNYEIKISHIGYYSQKFAVTESDTEIDRDVSLRSSIIDLGTRKVYARAYDPAQRIIAEAIRRKKDILSQIHDYSFDAYAKLVLTNADKPDTENIFLITETRSTSYWEQPDKYKEVITARRQSANMPAEDNMVTVGEMLNFNRNRIDLGRYDVVSPTATDAMDHYNYYLLDTVYVDSRAVFVLEVEPKNEYAPLFVGQIQIVDSTYDVVGVDVGFSKGIRLPLLDSARYHQSMAQIENRYWLPVEIGFSGLVSFDIPFPGIPRRINFAHIASIYQYRIDPGLEKGTFGEYEIEIDKDADDIDSAAWAAQRPIPLTATEVHGYERIDSLEQAPKPFYKMALMGLAGGVALITIGRDDIFHFNRVEGPYAGFRADRYDLIPNTRIHLATGYSFENKLWQYQVGADYRLSMNRRLWLSAEIKDEIVPRPTIISNSYYNFTTNALLFKIDPFDYYREKGVNGYLSFKPVNHTRLRLTYHDLQQLSQSKTTDFGFFRDGITPRDNAAIIDGRMRSIAATFEYDSRRMIKFKDWDYTGYAPYYVILRAGVEFASPRFISNDFDFRRYFIQWQCRVRVGGWGITRLTGYAGSSDGSLPPQRYFIVDFHDPDFFKMTGFNTVKEHNFGGDRAAAFYILHDFGTGLFRHSGDRYLQRIPFGLTIHGGAMWTEFKRPPLSPESYLRAAPMAYSEIGFGLDNLTPFMTPFNLAVNFTWQLSDYSTEKFSLMFDFRF